MKTIWYFVLFVSILTMSCKKDKKEDPTPTPPPTTITVAVTGNVVDKNGMPIADVTVNIGNKTVKTNNNGFFSIPSVTVNIKRYQISFEKAGYFKLYRSGVPKAGNPIKVSVGLISESDPNLSAQKQFHSSQSDSVNLPDGSVVVFPANAFMRQDGNTYNGMVTVKACYLDPTWNKYPMFAFGGDLYGKDSTNKDVKLNPFIGLNVVIQDELGNALQLDSIHQKRATVRMKIPSGLVPVAPNQIEMWAYAPQQGAKQGKGSAVKTGDSYQGEVLHFSFWSCEESYDGSAIVFGYVSKMVNNTEVKMSGVPVIVGNQFVFTDINGKYTAEVPAGLPGIIIFPLHDEQQMHIINQPLQDGQTYQHNFILSNFYIVKGYVKTLNNQPISGASIYAYYEANGVVDYLNAITDNTGKFELTVKGGANEYFIYAQYGNLIKSIVLGNIQADTTINFIMQTFGNNRLVVNGQVIFDFTGDNENASIYGNFHSSPYAIYVEYLDHGLFEILINDSSFIPNIGQDYPLGNNYLISYANLNTMQTSEYLSSGTIRFTSYDIHGTQNGLIEGVFSGTDDINIATVSGKFSVTNSVMQLKKKKKMPFKKR